MSPPFPKAFPGLPSDDCDRPACDDVKNALSAALGGSKLSSSKNKAGTTTCPPNKAELGKSSWTLLHSMAAWYPDNPNMMDQQLMRNFFSALAQFYPCTYCATDFQEKLREKPVDASSREALCVWLCEQHNAVNEKLGKPIFKCDMRTLDERWRKSNQPGCSNY